MWCYNSTDLIKAFPYLTRKLPITSALAPFQPFQAFFKEDVVGKNTKCKEWNQRWLKSIWLLQFKGLAIVHAARCRGLVGHLQDKAIVNIIINMIYLCQDQTEWHVG